MAFKTPLDKELGKAFKRPFRSLWKALKRPFKGHWKAIKRRHLIEDKSYSNWLWCIEETKKGDLRSFSKASLLTLTGPSNVFSKRFKGFCWAFWRPFLQVASQYDDAKNSEIDPQVQELAEHLVRSGGLSVLEKALKTTQKSFQRPLKALLAF